MSSIYIHYIYIYIYHNYSYSFRVMVFHWSLSDSKSPPVSGTLLSILGVLEYAVVWMISTPPPASNSFSPCNSPLVTVPNAPIRIGIIVTFMFHSF